MTGLPRGARLTVLAATVAGLASVVAASAAARVSSWPWLDTAVLTLLLLASWTWPVVVYSQAGSTVVNADEGLLVLAVLTLPGAAVIAMFALGVAVAQLLRRRVLVKSAFNLGAIVSSAAAATLTFHLLGGGGPRQDLRSVGAAAVAAAVYFLVNTAWITALRIGLGSVSWRACLRVLSEDWLRERMTLVTSGTLSGLLLAAARGAGSWAIWLEPLLFAMLRQVLSGHFDARRDRDRLSGLFEATQHIHAGIDLDATLATLREDARRLLRCEQAQVRPQPPQAGELGSLLPADLGSHWLVVSGRGREEPFDAADQRLLDVLATVGASALANAQLFAQTRQQREEIATVLTSLSEGVCAFDAAGNVGYLNPVAAGLLGEAAGRGTAELAAIAARCLASGRRVTDASVLLTRADGSTFPAALTGAPIRTGDAVTGVVVAFHDITERVQYESELTHQAFHDQLTGLPNRRLFFDRLEHTLQRSARTQAEHAVLFLDVDRFKVVNDSLGHQCGDELLVVIASRIRALVRPSDTVARFGGDEFTVLLEDLTVPREAEATAHRIICALRTPIRLGDGREVVASVSIGLAAATSSDSPDDVLHNADVAMYNAKAEGTGRVHRYDAAAMDARSAARLDLEAALRQALAAGELEVYYQPLVESGSGRIADVEALVRWTHPEQGLLTPDRFIGVAEDSGLILPLGRYVLDRACQQARIWHQEYGYPVGISVNLSARQFQDPDLVADVHSALTRAGINPGTVCLEITESLAMRDIEQTLDTLSRLKLLGVRLAIDDFGTGHSSLNYLKRFPVDMVKIDRSFITDIESSPVDEAIVTAVIGLASATGMTTVAEGVETPGQLRRLRELGTDLLQGFLLARPLEPRALTALLNGPLDLVDVTIPGPRPAGARLVPRITAPR